jgi:hypothetical protein
MDLQDVEWSMDWIYLAHDRDKWQDLVNARKKPRVSQNVESLSIRTLFNGVWSTEGFVFIRFYLLYV